MLSPFQISSPFDTFLNKSQNIEGLPLFIVIIILKSQYLKAYHLFKLSKAHLE